MTTTASERAAIFKNAHTLHEMAALRRLTRPHVTVKMLATRVMSLTRELEAESRRPRNPDHVALPALHFDNYDTQPAMDDGWNDPWCDTYEKEAA